MRQWFHRNIFLYWKSWTVMLTPLLLSPLVVLNTPESNSAFVILLMSVYWVSVALPLAVTSLLPIALFPLLGVMGTNDVCSEYFKGSNVVFFCGVALALGVQQSNLHRRIALKALLFVGTDPKWLLLVFMFIAMMLSMWITNSAVTAMLLPIVKSLLEEIFEEDGEINRGVEAWSEESARISSQEELTANSTADVKTLPENTIENGANYRKRVAVAMNISIAYSSSIGGAATLIGSGAPLLLKGIVEGLYPSGSGLTFPSFMAVAVPIAIINTLLTWAWLCFLFIGFRSKKTIKYMKNAAAVQGTLAKQYDELGPMTFHQYAITVLFGILIALWFFKDPGFMTGWLHIFPNGTAIGDATAGVVILVLAFILPAKPSFWCLQSGKPEESLRPSPSVLDWSYTQKNFQWNVLLLLGGGYALSEATKVSKLDAWMGGQLSGLDVLPPFVMMMLACFITSSVTEVSSNTATGAIFLPVLAKLAESTGGNALYLMIPAAINCCYAFMLPVGTPCNAMVLSSAHIRIPYMIKAGIAMKLFTILVSCLVTQTIGDAVFHWQTTTNSLNMSSGSMYNAHLSSESSVAAPVFQLLPV